MIEKLEFCAAIYSTLAFGFAYPEADEDFAPLAAEMETALALAGQMGWSPDASALRASLVQLRATLAPLSAEAFTPAEEYTHLFHRQALCPPYESSYSLAGMEQSLADIAGFHRAFGVQMSPEARERVDHIGSELEFMAVLCAKEARARQQGLDEQAHICRQARASFLADHLGQWALLFATRLREKARLPLYPAFADLLASLLVLEAADLGVILAAAPVEPALVDADNLACE